MHVHIFKTARPTYTLCGLRVPDVTNPTAMASSCNNCKDAWVNGGRSTLVEMATF